MDCTFQSAIATWMDAKNAYIQNPTTQTSANYVCDMTRAMGCLQIQHPLTKTVLSERIIESIRNCFLNDNIITSECTHIVIQQFIRTGIHNLESRCILDSWLREYSRGESYELAATRIWLFVCRQLRLSRLHLTALPNVFAIPRFYYITSCNLAENELTDLPQSFSALHLLTHLDLSHNQFLTCPNAITSLPRLAALFMDHNLCASLPSNVAQLASIEFLSFVGNPFTQNANLYATIHSIYQSSWTCEIRLFTHESFERGQWLSLTRAPLYSSTFTEASELHIVDHLFTLYDLAQQPRSSMPIEGFVLLERKVLYTLKTWLGRMIRMIHSTSNAAARQQIARRIIAVLTPVLTNEDIRIAFLVTTYHSPHNNEVYHEHLAASLITLPLIYDMIAIQDAETLIKKYFQGPYMLYVLEEAVRQAHSSLTGSIPPQELLSSYLTIVLKHLNITFQHTYNPFPSHEVADQEKNALTNRITANIGNIGAFCSFLTQQPLWEKMLNQRTSDAIMKVRRGAEFVIDSDNSPEAELLTRRYIEPVIIDYTTRALQELGFINITEPTSMAST